MKKQLFLTGIGLSAFFGSFGGNNQLSTPRPNILIILADDMGFSDIGCFGSEINTPNIDQLAKNGVRFTQFYNAARCCPTRASLLTGLYPHQAGMGYMSESNLPDNYQGYLNKNCVTIAQVLKSSGYFTAATGKWHVGDRDSTVWPLQRGFDRFYGIPSGGGFYGGKATKAIFEGNNEVIPSGSQLPKNYYTTTVWADHTIQYISEATDQNKPFFMYLAFNAPHWPLQAPQAIIQKYLGMYKNGVEDSRKKRYQRMLESGIIDKRYALTPLDTTVKSWESLSANQRLFQDSIMATYAACVELMDLNIGRVVDCLKQKGVINNTLIFFLSDNGGCAEGINNGLGNNSGSGAVGNPMSFVQCGRGWANLQNTPFYLYKHYAHEGGIHTPLVVHWPDGIKGKNQIRKQAGHIIDLMATCVDVSGADYPKMLNGNAIIPFEGISMIPAFRNQLLHRDTLAWEHEGNRAIRINDWKLVSKVKSLSRLTPKDVKNWELYNLNKDPSEMVNLAASNPEKVMKLSEAWVKWALSKKVLPSPWGSYDTIQTLIPRGVIKKK
jgi:arylsulfatase